MKNPKIGIIVQARMGSTRLHGKVMKLLDNEDTVLDVLIKRLKLSKLVDEIIIATTPDKTNSAIIGLAQKYEVSHFIGSEENVLERYFEAAKKFKIDLVIRITSDCPFIDPEVLDHMIEFYSRNDYDYISNPFVQTNFPIGFSIEIFSFEILEKLYLNAETVPEKEHVTYYLIKHSNEFKIYHYDLDDLLNFKDLRLTVDEADDLKICREIYKLLKEKGKLIDFTVYDIIDIINEKPELLDINKHVIQKRAKKEDEQLGSKNKEN